MNGLTAKILKAVPPKTDGHFRCPNYHFSYVLLDPPPPGVDDLGSLDVAADGTVDCGLRSGAGSESGGGGGHDAPGDP